jgi:hypothetical protein
MNKNNKRNLFNVTFFTIFQIAFIILMSIFGSYDNTGQNEVPTIYASKLNYLYILSFMSLFSSFFFC